jgi:hypothetical protein
MKLFPEFRDLVVEPAPLGPAQPGSGSSNVVRQAGRSSGVRRATTAAPAATDPEAVDLSAPAEGRPPGSGRSARQPPEPVNDTVFSPAYSGRLPHIPIHQDRSRGGFEWLMWLGVLIIALGSAFAAYFYFFHKPNG